MAQGIVTLFERIEAVLTRTAIWAACIVILAAFQTFLIVTHQPWADEWQAALIALEAPDWGTMFAWLRYEGHPWLWYGFLRVLGWVFAPENVLWIAALICAAFVQGAILFASPFARFERLLLASSQYVLFEFLTVSRGATLGAALLVAAMISWRSRWFWLMMALLPMVDFLYGVISGVFLILQWRAGRLWWPGIALWLAGSALAAFSMLPASDMVSAFNAMAPYGGEGTFAQHIMGFLRKLGSLPIPFQGGIAPQWNSPVFPIEGFAWLIMGALCWVLTTGQAWQRLLIAGFFGFTLAMSLALYPLGLRHLMLGAFLLILFVWRQRADKQPQAQIPRASFQVWLAVLAICGISSATISSIRGFDSAPMAAKQIEQLGIANNHWVMMPEWRAPALAGRLPVNFVRPDEDCTYRFVRWDYVYSPMESPEAIEAWAVKTREKLGKFYLISDFTFSDFPEDVMKPIAEIPKGYSGIGYYIYVVGEDLPTRPVSFTPCSAPRTSPTGAP